MAGRQPTAFQQGKKNETASTVQHTVFSPCPYKGASSMMHHRAKIRTKKVRETNSCCVAGVALHTVEDPR